MVFFFLKETKNNIAKNTFLTLSTVFIFSIILFVFGIYYFGYNQLSRIIGDIKGGTYIRVFFDRDADVNEIEKLMENLKSRGYFHRVDFIDRADALSEFYDKNPHLRISMGDLEVNPLPHSLNLELTGDTDNLDEIRCFLSELEKVEIIDEIIYSREWIDKFSRIVMLTRYISLFVGIILLVFSVLIIFIITNLNIYFRKDVIDIMRLIGSPYRNIKIPIIIEGFFNGLLAGIISSILLHLVIKNIYIKLLELKGIFESIVAAVDLYFYLWIIIFGILCSVTGAFTAIEFFLRREKNQ